MESLRAALVSYDPDQPFTRLFLQRHSGLQFAFLPVLQGDGEFPPHRPLQIVLAEAAARSPCRRRISDGSCAMPSAKG
jgi:hypothetical protein